MTFWDFDLLSKVLTPSPSLSCPLASLFLYAPSPPPYPIPTLSPQDDLIGHVDINLGNYTYCNEMRRDMVADLDTQGEVVLQVRQMACNPCCLPGV